MGFPSSVIRGTFTLRVTDHRTDPERVVHERGERETGEERAMHSETSRSRMIWRRRDQTLDANTPSAPFDVLLREGGHSSSRRDPGIECAGVVEHNFAAATLRAILCR